MDISAIQDAISFIIKLFNNVAGLMENGFKFFDSFTAFADEDTTGDPFSLFATIDTNAGN